LSLSLSMRPTTQLSPTLSLHPTTLLSPTLSLHLTTLLSLTLSLHLTTLLSLTLLSARLQSRHRRCLRPWMARRSVHVTRSVR
jgi:hypothetical protein